MTTWRASGILLGDEIVEGTSSTIMDAILRFQFGGAGDSDRDSARRGAAVPIAQEMQDEIMAAAAKAGRLDSRSVTTDEMVRLKRGKALPDKFEKWMSPIPLVLVAFEGEWPYASSRTRVINPASDADFVISLTLTFCIDVERIG